jgi:ArsR family transcriptional regulator, arsenate/arsenite/antimonite-responsive transcriptional repressor
MNIYASIHMGGCMRDLLLQHQALSDETRLRLLLTLRERSFCVCELTELLGVSQTNVSKHLTKLRDWGLVTTKRRERFIEYSLSTDKPHLQHSLVWIEQNIAMYPKLAEDLDRARTHECVQCRPSYGTV